MRREGSDVTQSGGGLEGVVELKVALSIANEVIRSIAQNRIIKKEERLLPRGRSVGERQRRSSAVSKLKS